MSHAYILGDGIVVGVIAGVKSVGEDVVGGADGLYLAASCGPNEAACRCERAPASNGYGCADDTHDTW